MDIHVCFAHRVLECMQVRYYVGNVPVQITLGATFVHFGNNPPRNRQAPCLLPKFSSSHRHLTTAPKHAPTSAPQAFPSSGSSSPAQSTSTSTSAGRHGLTGSAPLKSDSVDAPVCATACTKETTPFQEPSLQQADVSGRNPAPPERHSFDQNTHASQSSNTCSHEHPPRAQVASRCTSSTGVEDRSRVFKTPANVQRNQVHPQDVDGNAAVLLGNKSTSTMPAFSRIPSQGFSRPVPLSSPRVGAEQVPKYTGPAYAAGEFVLGMSPSMQQQIAAPPSRQATTHMTPSAATSMNVSGADLLSKYTSAQARGTSAQENTPPAPEPARASSSVLSFGFHSKLASTVSQSFCSVLASGPDLDASIELGKGKEIIAQETDIWKREAAGSFLTQVSDALPMSDTRQKAKLFVDGLIKKHR